MIHLPPGLRPAAAVLSLCLAAPIGAQAAEVKVAISNFTFTPAVVTVAPGDTVTWVNEDDTPHSVVAADKSFRSAALDTDQKFSMTVAGPGEIAYFCGLLPHRTGTVVVR